MEVFIGFLVVIVIIVVVVKVVGDKNQQVAVADLVSDAEIFLKMVKHKKRLSSVPCDLMLKRGESCFYFESSDLYETRSVRHYQSGHAGVRVAKGVYLGGSKGKSVGSEEWSHISTGRLAITNKRLIFDGDSQNRTIQLDKIIGVSRMIGQIEVSVEGRQKSMVFSVPNPLILNTIILICNRVDDPTDLGDTDIDISF